jgi:hypothetical protein
VTPKSALGDRKPKRRFRRQFPHTETSPYLQNAAEARGFERSTMLGGGDRTGWLGREMGYRGWSLRLAGGQVAALQAASNIRGEVQPCNIMSDWTSQ